MEEVRSRVLESARETYCRVRAAASLCSLLA